MIDAKKLRDTRNKRLGVTLAFETFRKHLLEEGDLKGLELLPTKKPTHGNCCTCQKCGHYHDECICGHNGLLLKLDKLEKELLEQLAAK